METMMRLYFTTLLLSFAALLSAQTALDPTNGGQYPLYPAYLNASCGGVSQAAYETRANDDGTTDAAFRFTTKCSTGGRGTKPRTYESCWFVTFDAAGAVTHREWKLYANWLQGDTAIPCPGL